MSELLDAAKRAKDEEARTEAERLESAQREVEKQESERKDHEKLVELSNKRAAEFVELMHLHNIPPVDFYAADLRQPSQIGPRLTHQETKLLGRGWVVEMTEIVKDQDQYEEKLPGVILLDDLKAYRWLERYHNTDAVSTDITLYWHDHPMDAPFAGESGVELLGKALVRLGGVEE